MTSYFCQVNNRVKKSDILCFQVLLSFVSTIFHFSWFPTFPLSLGRFGFRSRGVTSWRPSTTKCPREDHRCRLSLVGAVVKQKMQQQKMQKGERTFPNCKSKALSRVQKMNGRTRAVWRVYSSYSGYILRRRRSSPNMRTPSKALASRATSTLPREGCAAMPAQRKYKTAE